MHQFAYLHGALHAEQVNLEEIADAVGTPAYVYSAGTIRANYRRLQKALAGLDHRICFALKANSNLAILKLLASEGAGFDLVSGGELFRVLRAGGSAGLCTFAGVGKTIPEIRFALENGVHCFNVESEPELERINSVAAELGVRAPIAVRVNPNVDARTHKFISTGKSQNKFGIGLDRASEVYELAASLPHLRIRGIQTHIGSQILETTPFVEAANKLIPLVREIHERHNLEFFSFGGGVGIVYDPCLASGPDTWWMNESPGANTITPEAYAEAIVPLLAPLGIKILFEPGRSLVGNAGVLLTEVQYVKRTPAKTFTIVDAGMNDLIRPALYEGHHEIVPLRENTDAEPIVQDVVGPVCESGDFFAQDRLIPPVGAGQRLALLSAGAYGFVMASNYNSRPLPTEVLVEDNTWRVIRERQSWDDLIAGETA